MNAEPTDPRHPLVGIQPRPEGLWTKVWQWIRKPEHSNALTAVATVIYAVFAMILTAVSVLQWREIEHSKVDTQRLLSSLDKQANAMTETANAARQQAVAMIEMVEETRSQAAAAHDYANTARNQAVALVSQAEAAKRQFELATAVAASQERMAQNKLEADLIPFLMSADAKTRDVAINFLKRSVPLEVYTRWLSMIAKNDSTTPEVRKEAIVQLGKEDSRLAVQSLGSIVSNSNRPESERNLAKEAQEKASLNYARIKACDLNGDGIVNVADVQLAIAQASGSLPCTNADLNHTGMCTVADVQRVITASITGQCASTP